MGNRLIRKSIIKGWSFIAIVLIASISILGISYGQYNGQAPSLVITIHENNDISYYGDIFGGELWYPGLVKSGVIKISNETSNPVRVASLSTEITLTRIKQGVPRDLVYQSFLDNMELTLANKRLWFFHNELVDNKLKEVVSKEDAQGVNLLQENGIIIPGNADKLLDYTLGMNSEAGDELEDLEGTVTFAIGFN
jgi:hypothetical protein